MRIYLRDQTSKLQNHLQRHLLLSVVPYRINRLKEKVSTIQIPYNKKTKEHSLDFLFNYNIFPSNILTAYTQWQHEERAMQIGDTIVQQIYFPPIKTLSQKLVAGVRIKEIFLEDNLQGFSYETLHGHIEKGISYFLIEKAGRHINFTIRTYSKANYLILNLLSPFFSSPYQDYCTKKALHQVMKAFQNENK